ncbi:hypothetical protein [Bacteroides acidifaciens]|uniref:hypothetical protein n=1 Tax=Bacteroides acidifaciens TaxID=85831 RepID=UPI003F693DBF
MSDDYMTMNEIMSNMDSNIVHHSKKIISSSCVGKECAIEPMYPEQLPNHPKKKYNSRISRRVDIRIISGPFQ